MRESERQIAEMLRTAGCRVIDRGWPDLLVVKNGHAYCLEIKAGADKVSVAQEEMHNVLKSLGIPVITMKDGDTVATQNVPADVKSIGTELFSGFKKSRDDKPPACPQYVHAERLLEILFDPTCRPSLRWLRGQQHKLPHVRIGRLVYFDPAAVKSWLDAKSAKNS